MGLIGGMARTAVVAGTATAVSNRVSRRQANRWSQPEQSYEPAPQPAPAPAPQSAGPTPDRLAQLKEAAELKQAGILSEAEFEVEKARILQY